MLKVFEKIAGLVVLGFSLQAMAQSNIPDYYSEPGFQPFRDYESQQAIEHIDPFTGGLQLQHIDLVVPGNGGLDIVVRRIYRSPAGPAGVIGHDYMGGRTVLGLGWDLHFGHIWHGNSFSGPGTGCGTGEVSSQSNPVLELADGTRKVLVDSDSSTYGYITKDRWIGKCLSGGGLEVISPNGTKYTFDYFHVHADRDAWHVTHIEDRFGNGLDISYYPGTSTQHALIQEISSSDGRSVTFHYDDTSSYAVLLKEIRLNGSWRMRYYHTGISGVNSRFYLDRAERREAGDWNYSYYETRPSNDPAGLYALQYLDNPYGTRTTYGYGEIYFSGAGFSGSTVVESKSVSGGGITSGAWLYNYSPGSTDVTTIKSPNYCVIYEHKGAQSVSNGQVWRVGTLQEKRYYNTASCTSLVKTETYNWTNLQVSSQNEYHRRTNAADDFTYQPVLSSRTITLDGSNYTTTYSGYDAYGNPGSRQESGPNAASRSTTYTYANFTSPSVWVLGQVDQETISSVGVIDRDYYTSSVRTGSLSQISRFGVTTSYDYYTSGSNLGAIRTITDPESNTVTYSNYYRGVPRSESHPEGVSISRTVNSTGTIATETNGRGKTTSYSYDTLNRIESITTPKSTDSNITIDWTSGGRVRTLTRGTFGEVRTSDGFGRLIEIDAEGLNKSFEYNPEGQLTFESYPHTGSSSQGTSYQRDVLSRIKRITHADSQYIQYDYLSGNRVRVTNERGHVTTYTYRSYGDPDERYLVKIEAPEAVTTDIARDKIGNITAVTQGGVTRSYPLDSRKFPDYEVHPETGTTQLSFDNAGNLTGRAVGSSSTTFYIWDDLNRLDYINYPAGTPDVDYVYDGNNNLVEVSNGVVKWSYDYDDNDNLDKETFTYLPDNRSFVIDYAYDNLDNLESIVYPNSLAIDYAPDDLGRPTKVGDFVNTTNFHPNGGIKNLYFANGRTTSITQDARLFTDTIATTGLVDLAYDYDGAGNMTSITDQVNPTNSLSSLTYDQLNRLTGVIGAVWGSGSIGYTTDGDIASKNIGGLNLSYTYNSSNNRLTGVSGGKAYSFTYDVYGNVIGNGWDAFIYNDASQLTGVTSKNIQYQYDGNNRRAAKVEGGQLKKHMLYNRAGQLLFESDPLSDFQAAYVYLGSTLIARQDYCGDLDGDGDGLGSCVELRLGLNPANSDTDGDGTNDGGEDTDTDGMPNAYEADNGLDPAVDDAAQDADSDGLTNLDEYNLDTSPNDADSDNDGMPDGWEVTNSLDPLLNDTGGDADSDGLTNGQEYSVGTNPQNPDTDGDGISDSNDDQDGDTMPNLYELSHGLNPKVNDGSLDLDNDGLSNLDEFSRGTLPNDTDTDNDGMPDGWEVSYGLDPLTNDAAGDADYDGLSNLAELQNNTKPNDWDTDNDGASDGQEVSQGTNPLDMDTDNDGMYDGFEIRYQLNPLTNDATLDPDGDGLTNLQEFQLNTHPKKADTDGDGVNDGDEVTAGTDPLFNLAAFLPAIMLILN